MCTQDLQQSGVCHFKHVYEYHVLAITWSLVDETDPWSTRFRAKPPTTPTIPSGLAILTAYQVISRFQWSTA